MVILAKLRAQHCDLFGYITYVFENLESVDKYDKYIMTIRYPNWEHKDLNIEDEGYLHYENIKAGVDTWFDGRRMIPYKYDSTQFIKFVSKPEKIDNKYIM